MKTTANTWRALFSALAAIALIATLGCAHSTTRKDAANARHKLQNAHQQTTEAVHQGQQDVAAAQHKAQNYTAAKPVTPDQPAADQHRVADAEQNAAEKIANQKHQEGATATNLADKEQQHQATQARDGYVKQVEGKLAETDKQIDALKQRALKAQGADKDAINREVDTLKTQRDTAQQALHALKGADLATWTHHQEQVRVALQELDNSMRKVR